MSDESELNALLCDDGAMCKWLRDNSSGSYRASALAAERIEELNKKIKKYQMFAAGIRPYLAAEGYHLIKIC